MIKTAWLSPLPPARSGVADYAAALLPALARHPALDIDVWPGDSGLPGVLQRRELGVMPAAATAECLRRYELGLFHVGNHQAHHAEIYRLALAVPGLVVLHDYVLHHMVREICLGHPDGAERYVDEMAYAHGVEGARLARRVASGEEREVLKSRRMLDYPLNLRLIDGARAVVVHSRFAADLIRTARPDARVHVVPHFIDPPRLPSPPAMRRALGVPRGAFVLGTFGVQAPTKRVPLVLQALAALRSRHHLFFCIVGDLVDPAIRSTIDGCALDDIVRTTGIVAEADYLRYLAACDACVILRDPTGGETSGNVCRILGGGKPCILTDVGWFAELPEEVAVKLPGTEMNAASLASRIERLITDVPHRHAVGRAGARYAREHHALDTVVSAYARAMTDAVQRPTAP